MKKRIFSIFFCFIYSFVFSSCSQPTETPVEETYPVTAFGVRFEQAPTSVVPLTPAAAEMLMTLGYEDNIIARTDDIDFYEELSSLPSLGSSNHLDIDQLVSLHPSLVLTTQPLSKQTLETLSNHSIKAVTVPLASNLRELQSYYCAIACIFSGIDPGIEQGKNAVQPYIDKLTHIANSLPETKVNYLILSDLSGTIVTGDSFVSSLFSILGTNVAEDGKQNQYDLNTAISANPAVIFLYAPYTLENLQTVSIYSGTDAVINQRVFSMDGSLFERRSLSCIDTLCALAEEIYPEIVTAPSTEE